MDKLVPAMDEPQRRPLPWETQARSSEVFLRYILSLRMHLLSLPICL